MSDDSSSCSREDLYKQVWSEPMIALARKYGISDVGLRKKCRKLNIPLPSRGYWLRSEKRRTGHRLPLPSFKGNDTVEIKKSRKESPPIPADQGQYNEAEVKIAFEKLTENQIQVPLTLTSPHPLVQKARILLKGIKSSADDDIIRTWREQNVNCSLTDLPLGQFQRDMNSKKGLTKLGPTV